PSSAHVPGRDKPEVTAWGKRSLVARRDRGRPLHIIPDNSSTHSTTAVQGWLVRHPHVQFHFTPKGASWLNHGRGAVQHPDAQVRPSWLLRHGARSRPAYPAQTSTSGTLIPRP